MADSKKPHQAEQIQPKGPVWDHKDRTARDISKVALAISLLSVVLLTILFFGLNENVTGLGHKVKTVEEVEHRLVTVEKSGEGLGRRMESVEGKAAMARRTALSVILDSAGAQIWAIEPRLEGFEGAKEMRSKLEQARTLVNEVRGSLEN